MSEIENEKYNNNDGRFFDRIYKSIDDSINKKDRNNIEERIVSEILTWLRNYEEKYSLVILGLFYYNPTIIQHEGIDPSSIEKYKRMFNDSLYFLEDMFIHSERYNIYYLKNIFNNFLEFHKEHQNHLYVFIGALSHCIDDSIELRESWGSELSQESINLILNDIRTSIHGIFDNRQDEFNKSFEEPNTDTNSYQEILDTLQMLQKKSKEQEIKLKQQAKRMKKLESSLDSPNCSSNSSSCSSNSSSCSSNSTSCSSNSYISINKLQEKLSQQEISIEQQLTRISELESAVSSSSSSSDRDIIKGVVTSIGNCKQDVDDLKKGQLIFAMDLGQKFVDFKTKCEGELEGLKSTYLEHNKQIETHVGKVLKVVEIVKENKIVAEQKISEIDSILVDINSSKESISNFVPDSTIKFEEFIRKNQELFQQSLDGNQASIQQTFSKFESQFKCFLEDSNKKRKREIKSLFDNFRSALDTQSDEDT